MSCIRYCLHPAKPPVNIYTLILVRVVTLTFIFLSFASLLLSIVVRPWKTEYYKEDVLEISLWTICRHETVNIYDRCFHDYFQNNEDIEVWFYMWRYFLIGSSCTNFISFVGLVIEFAYKENLQQKSWSVFSWLLFATALLTSSSIATFIGKFEFEFVEESFRWDIMGWHEETGDREGFMEAVGFPYILCCCSVIISFVSSYLCFVCKCQEDLYIDSHVSVHPTNLTENDDHFEKYKYMEHSVIDESFRLQQKLRDIDRH